ncbi:MAG: hypothetical protein AB3K77_01080 [Methanosarcinaceae archaeon]
MKPLWKKPNLKNPPEIRRGNPSTKPIREKPKREKTHLKNLYKNHIRNRPTRPKNPGRNAWQKRLQGVSGTGVEL